MWLQRERERERERERVLNKRFIDNLIFYMVFCTYSLNNQKHPSFVASEVYQT